MRLKLASFVALSFAVTIVPAAHALSIQFDYTYDTSNFFADPARRAMLQTAAASLPITDALAAIHPSAGDAWDATFPNPSGLKAISGNAYRVSSNSGAYNLKPPGTGGAGTISPSTLESSTVDLSAEFTGLITTQRAYSASSKIITTADQMMEELLNIKR